MKLRKVITKDSAGRPYLASYGIFEKGTTYAVSYMNGVLIFDKWKEQDKMFTSFLYCHHSENKIPVPYIAAAGMHIGETVDIIYDGETVFILRDRVETDLRKLPVPYATSLDGISPVRSGSPGVLVTNPKKPSLISLDGVFTEVDPRIIVTMRYIGSAHWLEVRPWKEEWGDIIPASKTRNLELSPQTNRLSFSDALDSKKRLQISTKWMLPSLSDCNQIMVKKINDVVIIEGLNEPCAVCGSKISSSDDYVRARACPKCRSLLEKGEIVI